MMRDIIVASGNAGKVREFGEILSGIPCRLSSLADHFNPVPEIPETGETFLENALIKARWVFERKNTWVMADDSGLEVDALGGRPGVLSARFAGERASAADNNRRLLEMLADVPGPRTARFRCVVVLMVSAQRHFVAEGICEGEIIDAPRGDAGFGYDPLFVPNGFTGTFAQLCAVEKNAVSHRGRALTKVKEYCHDLLE